MTTAEDYNRMVRAHPKLVQLVRRYGYESRERGNLLDRALSHWWEVLQKCESVEARIAELEAEVKLLRAVANSVNHAWDMVTHDTCYCAGCDDTEAALDALAAHDKEKADG